MTENATLSTSGSSDAAADTVCPTQAILTLISHAHSPPLQPPLTLKYDLRNVPNPPKQIRDSYTGLNKRLRSYMIVQSEFCALLERAEAEILQVMNAWESLDKSRSDSAAAGVMDSGHNGQEIRIGCSCARGRHRSVAFVEELARKQWPADWDVRVEHRDLYSSRGSSAKQKTRHQERRRSLRESYLEEPMEE